MPPGRLRPDEIVRRKMKTVPMQKVSCEQIPFRFTLGVDIGKELLPPLGSVFENLEGFIHPQSARYEVWSCQL